MCHNARIERVKVDWTCFEKWRMIWQGKLRTDRPAQTLKVKVKQSRYRPGMAQRVPGS
jgi:hypothetical protein